jgi:hypothetical protein
MVVRDYLENLVVMSGRYYPEEGGEVPKKLAGA